MPDPLSVEQVLTNLDERSLSGSAAELPLLVAELAQLELTDDARLLLRIIRAQARAHQGDSANALSELDALETQVPSAISGRDANAVTILESALNIARGIAYCDQAETDRALVCFRRALDVQVLRGDHWRISALHTNLAIAQVLSGDADSALISLAQALEALQRADVPDRWRRNRLGAIDINRAGALSMLGDLEGTISAYLRARLHLEAGGDRMSLGALDFNLSKVYMQSGRFGSALESAVSAHAAYRDAAATIHARRALTAQAAALRRMNRLAEAETLILRECLPATLMDISGTELVSAIEAVDELAHIYRSTNRYTDATKLERQSTSLALRLPNPEARAFSIIIQYVFDAIEQAKPGQPFRPPNELERTAVQAIRTSPKHAEAPPIADLLERLMRAYATSDYEEHALTDAEVRALEAVGWDYPTWRAQLNVAVGTHRGDDSLLLRGHLFDLARFHTLVAGQESPTVRSTMLASRGGLNLEVVLPLLMRTGNYAGLFEAIEWMRCDLGGSKVPSVPYDLVRFGQLLGVADDTSTTYALPTPGALSIDGRSVLHDADPNVDVVADAHDIRRALAGETSAWWTHMIFRGSLVWALLTPDGVHGGSLSLTAAAKLALQAHFQALPLALAEDVHILGEESAPWLRSVVAIARAAAGPLVQSAETLDQCISAAPDTVAARLREAFPGSTGTVEDNYATLGGWMIPAELDQYLTRYGSDARLLVSVQPESASIPTALLSTAGGKPLIERAVLLYAPPVRIAGELLRRHRYGGSARTHLLIRNPRGDLPDSDLTDLGSRTLSGWATAASADDVASREAVLRALRDQVTVRPSSLSYIGHIESGEFGDPASAALLLAPDSPGLTGSRLSARDVAATGVHMPDRVYLGGCEGAGFATSLEWSSIGAAALAHGSDVVLAHRWPIIDGRHAGVVDKECARIVAAGGDVAARLRSLQRHWLRRWREGNPDAVPPHFWSGLQAIGRSIP